MQTLKKMLTKSNDVCRSLLNYRSTPLPWCNLSPAELLMGRKLRTLLPFSLSRSGIICQNSNQQFKDKQKENYDRHHAATEMPLIPDDSEVWVTSGQEAIRGRIVSLAPTPRSYLIETPSGLIRRNQQHLRAFPEVSNTESQQSAVLTTINCL